MDLETNLSNAIEVLTKTYESVDKLMKFCDAKAEDHGYEVTTDRFLRYKSDRDCNGWLVDFFIKCYQDSGDKGLENEFRDGPIYMMEIDLKAARIWIGKFVFENMKEWSKGISPASYWIFDNPLWEKHVDFIVKDLNEDYMISTPINKDVAMKSYWGLKYAIYNGIKLEDITGDNAEANIFGTFDALKTL